MDSRLGGRRWGWKKRKAGEISAQPSVRESHRLRLPTPLGRFQHTRHRAVHIWIITAAQLQPCHPVALPTVHQTSIDWVHLVPCDAFRQSLIYKEINGRHNNKGLNAPASMNLPHPPATQCIPMQPTNREPRSGRRLLLLSRPADESQVPDWLDALSSTVVIQAPVEEVNSDGKANLDILSTVKYGKELLNEQLIPRRYHVPEKT